MIPLLRFLLKRDRRTYLPRHLITEFDMQSVTDDERLIFKASRAKDRAFADHLMRKYKARNAMELLRRLPRRRRYSLRQRLITFAIRLTGELPYDPAYREYRRAQKHNRLVNGIRYVDMRVPRKRY